MKSNQHLPFKHRNSTPFEKHGLNNQVHKKPTTSWKTPSIPSKDGHKSNH